MIDMKQTQLHDILEIVLITYNRCAYLKSTLESIQKSSFSGCKITVFDNCSVDLSSEIVCSFMPLFPNLVYHRNRLNIGGNPNYLKAIESSTSEYTWVLCDDDKLVFDHCDDVVVAVESCDYDLIEVGANSSINREWPRGLATTAQHLVDIGLDFYNGLSFFPAYIFRTNLFDSHCFCWGYKNIDRLYPQFEFINKSIRENFSIYLAKNRIVTRNELNAHSFYPLEGYASWVSCCNTIENHILRERVIEEYTTGRGFCLCLCFWTILYRKMNNDGRFWLRIVEMLSVFSLKQRLKYLPLLLIALIPCPISFWVWLRAFIYRQKGVSENEVPVLSFLDRG